VRRWVLFWCVQSYAWAWNAPAALQLAGHELAPDPYSKPIVLAPDPYAVSNHGARPPLMNARSRRARSVGRLAPNAQVGASAALAPLPYAGEMPERELARPSSQALALAASPYGRAGTPALAPDPY
jgi:hypothetical protein